MNPMLKRLLVQPARENLVEDAVNANKTEGTTDPEQIQKNVDFEAELARLKELQADPAGSAADAATDPAADPAQAEGEGEGASADANADAGGDAGDAGDAGAAAPDQAADASADPAPDQTDPEKKDGEEGGDSGDADKDGDDAADQNQDPQASDEDPGNGNVDTEAAPDENAEEAPDADDAEVAQEALRVAVEALNAMARAHELGVVKNHHVALFDAALESQYISLGTVKRPAVSTESDVPESSASKLKYAVGRAKEFLREVLVKMREYAGKILNWIKAFFQGWREHYGHFEKNTEGLLKRIAYLKGKERPAEEIEKLAAEKTVSVFGLATSDEIPTLDSVADAIKAVHALTTGILYSVTEESAYGHLVNLVTRASQKDLADTVTGIENALTPERMFRVSGSASIFANADLYKNTRKSESARKGMVEYRIEGILGMKTYKWTLAADDAINIDEVIHQNNSYGFAVESAKLMVQAPLFTSLDDCSAAMQLVSVLSKELLRMKDAEKFISATQGLFTKNEAAMKQVVELVDADEDTKIKVLMVHSTSQSAYTSLFVKSVTSHVKVMESAITDLQRWVAESLNIIAPEKNPQA